MCHIDTIKRKKSLYARPMTRLIRKLIAWQLWRSQPRLRHVYHAYHKTPDRGKQHVANDGQTLSLWIEK